jgi:hypothetical protein
LVVHADKLAHEGLQEFVESRLRSDVEQISEGRTARFVAGWLSAPNLPGKAVQEYVAHLTAGSLQSAAELIRIERAFGLSKDELTTDFEKLKPTFNVRNMVVHELDINLDGARRKRNVRKEEGHGNQCKWIARRRRGPSS